MIILLYEQTRSTCFTWKIQVTTVFNVPTELVLVLFLRLGVKLYSCVASIVKKYYLRS